VILYLPPLFSNLIYQKASTSQTGVSVEAALDLLLLIAAASLALLITIQSRKIDLLGIFFTVFVFSVYATASIAQGAATSFNRRVIILAPHISQQQEKELRAAWALMSNRGDYDAINATMAGYAAEHKITVPNPWP
jgi:ABC-type lipoprotein release transport system permease subunit